MREYRQTTADPVEQAAQERTESVVRDTVVERQLVVGQVVQFIATIAGIVVGLLVLRILPELLAANPANGLVRFVDGVSDVFVGIVANPGSDGHELDVAAMSAIIVDLLIVWGLRRLVWILFSRASVQQVARRERTGVQEEDQR